MTQNKREFWINPSMIEFAKYDICTSKPEKYKNCINYIHTIEITPESSLELEELKRDKERLEDENKRMRSVFVQIQKLGCLYKGNLTGCAGCIICNEFPEFNEMNKRDRSGLENN
jgi:hypothetical protein